MARRSARGAGGGQFNPVERLNDYYQQVADALIERIERGTAPWTQAWAAGSRSLPRNVHTEKAYRSGNSVWLISVAERRGYSDERWGTYRQVQALGGNVRKGERGTRILKWIDADRRRARGEGGKPLVDGGGRPVYETRVRERPCARIYTVFNAEQCDGLPAREAGKVQAWDAHAGAEAVLAATGARIEHSGADRACYDIRGDRIMLPYKACFPEPGGYYQAALHELGHWTGHASRLNRATLTEGIVEGPYSKQYAREELRAEISSMMSGDRLQIGHDPARSASYVSHWVKALRDDNREIHRAARDAQDMSDYILGRERDRFEGADEREGEKAARPAAVPSSNGREKAARPAAVPSSNGREKAARPAAVPSSNGREKAARPAAVPSSNGRGEQLRLFDQRRPSSDLVARARAAVAARPEGRGR